VGSNAMATEQGMPTWRVSGKHLMDRDVELLATSRVARRGR